MVAEVFYREFGRLLQEARSKGPKHLTQAALAEAVGLSRSSVANIEKGRQPVQLHLLVKIAEVLSIDPVTLLPRQLPQIVSNESKAAIAALQGQGASPKDIERALSHTSPRREQ
jgi:transcriptional regulator with XRE-family HTH domain